MGHYEEHYAASDNERAKRREERIAARAKDLEEALTKKGLARVLSEMYDEIKYGVGG